MSNMLNISWPTSFDQKVWGRLGELSGTLSRSRSPNKSQFWAQKVWKTIRIHWFLSFLAPKRKSVCNFFKITTTFTVQIAICWPCYRVLFRPDSPRDRPILGGPRENHRARQRTISSTPNLGVFIRRCELPFRPHLPAHIPRMTFVSTGKLPQINHQLSIINYQLSIINY